MLIKYKEQPIINLNNVTYIIVDQIGTDGTENSPAAIRFHFTDGFEKQWNCTSVAEAKDLECKLLNDVGSVIA